MKNLKTSLLSLLIFIFCPLIANAIIGQTISYQGFLIGKSDNLPVNTAQDINFVFYNVETGGTSIYGESRCNVGVLNGRYEVEIGSVTSGGIPDTLFINNPNIWLEVQIDPDNDCSGTYEPLQPRIKMQAAPYAFNSLYASTASAATTVFKMDIIETLDNTTYGAVTISSNLFVQGGISVGAISPGQKLAVNGIVESSIGGFRFPDGTMQITAAGETKWGVKVRGDEEDLYTLIGVGNVGVGSGEYPLAKLHVSSGAGESGNIFMVSTGTAGSDTDIFRVTGESKVYADYFYGYLTGAASKNILKTGGAMTGNLTILGSSLTIINSDTSVMNSIEITTDTSKSAYHFVVSTSGYVGIGLNNPQYPLHIVSSQGAAGTLLLISTGTSNVFEVKGNGDVVGGKFYGDGSALTDVISSDISKVFKTGDTMTGQLTIFGSSLTVTGGIYSVSSITADGGIFGSSLTVEVANIISLTASSGTFKTWGANQYSLETTSGILVNTGIINAPYFVGDGSLLSNVLGIDSTKLLKAGDTMTGKLAIVADGAELYSLTVATAPIVNDYSLVITTQGNIGIQIVNPAAPLDVHEQIKISRTNTTDFGNSIMHLYPNMGNGYIRWSDKILLGSGGENIGVLGSISASAGPTWDLAYRAAASNMSTGVEVFRIKSNLTGNEWKFGIGTENPVEKFHINANTLIGADLNSSVLYISTTNAGVGIATTTISHKLTVNGGIAASSITASAGFYGDFNGVLNTSSITIPGNIGIGANDKLAKLEIRENGNETYTMLVGTNPAGGLGNKYDMVVTTQGMVGIGIDSPGQTLHIKGAMRIDNDEALSSYVHLRPEGGDAYIYWDGIAIPTKGILGIPGNTRELIYRAASSNLTSGGVEVFRIKEDGRFGIGTNAPNYRLHISSGSGETGNILVVSTGTTNLFRVTGESKVYADYFYGNGSNLTGIITESGGAIIGDAFSVGTSTFVVNSGKVGIGIVAPSKELQTIGEIRVSTSATSTAHLNMAGAVDSLPITGYDEGVMIYLTTDHTLYISTETVTTATSWKAVW
ncbi:MAG: hypothetical protein L6420_07285 [Elusimicrobia bacterium]|nr:hypothetical protein [Elusimicrobiota bacterium]